MFLLIGHLVWFTNNLRKVNTETQIHEFLVSTDGAKRKERDYMETSSRTLRDWKKLIGLNDWTAEEIPRKLDDLISSADITAQVLLTDTLRGYSSAAPAGKPGEYGREYSNTYFSIFQTLTRFRESGRPDDVIITSSFTNPINAETSIAFVTQIETRDESGAAASAFLLYVEPLRALQEEWTPDALDAELAAQLEQDDDAMDDLERDLFKVLLDDNWPYGAETAIDGALLGRFYERYADHAVNIGEQIAYLVTGEPITEQ